MPGASAPLPFQIDERVNVGEETRLKYRYLDLRRPAPGAAIRLRSEVNRVARTLLAERGFVNRNTDPDSFNSEGAATFWFRRGSSRAPGTRCRRARNCSSSC